MGPTICLDATAAPTGHILDSVGTIPNTTQSHKKRSDLVTQYGAKVSQQAACCIRSKPDVTPADNPQHHHVPALPSRGTQTPGAGKPTPQHGSSRLQTTAPHASQWTVLRFRTLCPP